ncbi:uncharacterized protein LOC142321494 isoform X2 [Lycorma delicatula]|uniref:uncharacterized protein LOC142321494 isoform X2 n=1 Tax=Lycorma delicatula TaxID=130591 RepID=UPI003F50E0B0
MYEKQATENLKKELNELESLHSCNLLTISELNEKNSTLMINLEEIKHELTLNIYKLDELRKVVSDDKEEIVNLNLELLSKDKIIEELNITVKEYNDFQFAHSNCNEIKEAVDSLINDFCRLEKNRNVLKNENEILKDDKTKLQLSYEKASNELKNLTNKLVEKEKELRTCFENQLADVKENTRMDNEEKSRSSEQRDIKCEELKKEKLLKKELKYVKKKWKHEKQATENLKKELNKLEILYSCNQSKISELNEKNSTLTKDFLKVKHESTHNYNIYIYKLDELRNVVSDDKEEIVNLNLELLSKDKIIEELNIVVNEYSDFKSDHSNCNEIKEAVNSLRNDLFMLEESRSVLRYENEILKGDKTKLQLSYEKATNELKNLANKLVVREKQLQTYYEDKLADIKENMQEQLTTTQLKLIIKNLNLEICDLKKITYF